MTELDQLVLIGGEAASLKGERGYVHGTSLVPEIDNHLARTTSPAVLTGIEFHQPLRTLGVLAIGDLSAAVDRGAVAATGVIRKTGGGELHFCVFPSPFAVPNRRSFDEASLLRASTLSDDRQTVSLKNNGIHSPIEHLSSAMKRLCQANLPQHARWWFARLTKDCALPRQFNSLEITLRRVTVERVVTAMVTIDGIPLGRIDFVGATE